MKFNNDSFHSNQKLKQDTSLQVYIRFASAIVDGQRPYRTARCMAPAVKIIQARPPYRHICVSIAEPRLQIVGQESRCPSQKKANGFYGVIKSKMQIDIGFDDVVPDGFIDDRLPTILADSEFPE